MPISHSEDTTATSIKTHPPPPLVILVRNIGNHMEVEHRCAKEHIKDGQLEFFSLVTTVCSGFFWIGIQGRPTPSLTIIQAESNKRNQENSVNINRQILKVITNGQEHDGPKPSLPCTTPNQMICQYQPHCKWPVLWTMKPVPYIPPNQPHHDTKVITT